MCPYGLAARKPLPNFIEGGAVKGVAKLAEQVVRKGHTFEGGARLEFAMKIRRHIPYLNHDRHAISILACGTHVNEAGRAIFAM